MRCALPGAVHALFFGIKRAFHGTLRVMRWPLHCYGLTAARFDMMLAIYRTPMRRARQSEVRRMLGVTAPTVSRMVKSLVALGFVRQDRDDDDGRERLVVLTRRGIERIRAAVQELIERGTAAFVLSCGLGGVGRWGDAALVSAAMSQLHGLLLRIREAFRDSAGLLYPSPPHV